MFRVRKHGGGHDRKKSSTKSRGKRAPEPAVVGRNIYPSDAPRKPQARQSQPIVQSNPRKKDPPPKAPSVKEMASIVKVKANGKGKR